MVVSNGVNLSSGGDIGGTADDFRFSYQQRSGDFDVKVRVASLTLASSWSEAGLVAREGLSPGARSANVMATPSINGCFFQSRTVTNGNALSAGSFPVNYPNTWLRLKRSGNTFLGYAGFDGENWTQLGSVVITMPANIYLGFAVASHQAGESATASFRDFETVTNAGVNGPLTMERLGQCSRVTSLVFSEIMYHPTNSELEFIELFNSRDEPENIGGYRLAGSIGYTFPAGTVIPGGGFLVVAKSPSLLQSVYGLSGVLGPFTNSLPNSGGTVTLLNRIGAVYLRVDYSDQSPWPVAADAGHSLVLARPSCGENNPQAWSASDAIGGSPGALDPIASDPVRHVVINEFLAHTDAPELDYMELYNHSNVAVDLTGCILTDNAATNKFIFPPTTLPARGRVSLTQNQLNFALNAAGETIFFKNKTGTRMIDAVRFGGQENGVATGRFPDGSDSFTDWRPGRPVCRTPRFS